MTRPPLSLPLRILALVSLAFAALVTGPAGAQDPIPAGLPGEAPLEPGAKLEQQQQDAPPTLPGNDLPPAPRTLEPPQPPAPTIIPAPDPVAGIPLDPEEIQGIIAIKEPEAFAAKLAELKAAGRLPEQMHYELRLLRAWQNQHITELKELATPGKLAEMKYEVAGSQFFASEAQLKSFIAVMQATVAASEGNEAELKAKSLDALWLFPEHAGMVGDLLTEYQRAQAMAKLTVPMDQELAPSAPGAEPLSLAELVAGKKALLLHFWASWAAPSVEQLPALVQLSGRLLPLGVATAGICTEANVEKAEAARKEHRIEFPWLMEPHNDPLVLLLEIDAVPRSVLVSPQGKVLFSGHPEDSRLQDALQKIGVEL